MAGPALLWLVSLYHIVIAVTLVVAELEARCAGDDPEVRHKNADQCSLLHLLNKIPAQRNILVLDVDTMIYVTIQQSI